MGTGTGADRIEAVSPSFIPFSGREAKPGIALCLSGGGYRAMLFHVGALWRLNEFGYLPKLDRVSSVSGGSITAGVLGMNWDHLVMKNGVAQNFDKELIDPIRSLADRTIDVPNILAGILLPGSIGDWIASSYERHLFGTATLQDLPADRPRFVMNATNLQSGVLWRFSRPYMRDYRVGEIKNPKTKLAIAVAASAAFPPILSPVRLKLDPSSFVPNTGDDLQHEPFTSEAVLADGGVYDNLGLEPAIGNFRTILVSDAGQRLEPMESIPWGWGRQTIRVLDTIDDQVRKLRARQLYELFKHKEIEGTYWGIYKDISEYGLPNSLQCTPEEAYKLATTPTRLKALDPALQERLINWGYAVTDAAMRKWVDPSLPPPDRALHPPDGFPYPGGCGERAH